MKNKRNQSGCRGGKPLKAVLAAVALTGILSFVPAAFLHGTPQVVCATQTDHHDSKLSQFDIAPGELTPAFDPDVFAYTSTVDEGVTSVSVQAVPRSSGGSIASVEGAKNLQPGVNTITVICSAPDLSYSTYTITLTVGGGTASADGGADDGTASADNDQGADDGTASADNGQGADDGTASADSGQGEADGTSSGKAAGDLSKLMGTISADGTVSLSGAAYTLSNNFSYSNIVQDIPSAFGQGAVTIGGTEYQSLHCDAMGVDLVYMENTDGNGSSGFYFYDETVNAVERFKYAGSGEKFVVFISTARDAVPEGYDKTTLKLPSDRKVTAYQQTESGAEDYFLIYGIFSDGTEGWYLYDNAQDTYMRYDQSVFASAKEDESAADDGEEEIVPTVTVEKYNKLNEKYQKARKNVVTVVSVMAIFAVVLIMVFTIILLRSQDDEDGEQSREQRERSRAKKQLKKTGRQPKTKNSLAAGRDYAKVQKERTKRRKEKEKEEDGRPEYYQPVKEEGISSPDQIREQINHSRASAHQRGLLGQERTVATDESVQLAAEKMRQSVQLARRNQSMARMTYPSQPEQPEYHAQRSTQYMPDGESAGLLQKQRMAEEPARRTMAEEDREAVFRPTRRISLDGVDKEQTAADEWEQEEAAASRRRAGRKKRPAQDDDMEIMDLNDL